MKKVSVVVPCYNVTKYLSRCMEYLLRQTIGLENMEIILVNDASTDHNATWNMILEYEQNFPDTVMAISLEKNLRQGGARNVGVSYASGEYLIFCDADDWLLEETLEHCYDAARKYDADVVEFCIKDVPDHDVPVQLESGDEDLLIELETLEQKKAFLLHTSKQLSFGSQKKFYRLSLIQENHITFAEHLVCEEPSFAVPVRLYEKRHYFLDEKLYICFLSPESTTRGNWSEKYMWDNLQVWISLVKDLTDRNLLWPYYQELEYLFFVWGFELSIRQIFSKQYVLKKEEWELITGITLTLFPNIQKNRYLGCFNDDEFSSTWEELLIALLKMKFTDENINAVNQSVQETLLKLH